MMEVTNRMYFVQFLATPRKNARTAPESAGAFVNCWIERPSLAEAINTARESVEAEGWIVDEPEMAHQVDAGHYSESDEGEQYFKQALIDKEVFVFHTFPDVDANDKEGV
ncbi:MAG: hypothetical protein ACR2FY_15930 [Pirellulaceae bacterium]